MKKLLDMPLEWYLGLLWIIMAFFSEPNSIDYATSIIIGVVSIGIAAIRIDLRRITDE